MGFLFLALPVLLAGVVLWALHAQRAGAAKIPALAIAAWFAITFLLARSGVVADFDRMPPKIPLLAVFAIACGLLLSRTAAVREALRTMPGWWPVAMQTFRAPLELGLYLLFTAGLLPEQMTFAGRNFDVLVGLSAPVLAWLMAKGHAPRVLQWAWHFAALGLLANVVTIAITSVPGPLHADWPGAPLTIVAQWPYVWLPAFLVPMALLGHVAAIARLVKTRPPELVTNPS